MKDNFSTQAKAYAQYRPYYPPEMISYIVSLVPHKDTALDVATGNGQVAAALAPYFKEVYGTDISAKQLQNAIPAPNLIYKEGSAEDTGFNNEQFNLVTVAQAIHWFKFDAFYAEVKRILKPDGIFVVMGYGLFSTNPETDVIINHFYKDIIGSYWDPERSYIDENYTTIPFPFKEIEAKKFTNRFTWTFEQLIGYLETWSAVQHYIKQKGTNPVDLICGELQSCWEKSDKQVTFPLLLRIGKM
ncbi:SAM-dependent methyltransferase [Flavobacterium rivuli WB 3.3-2 = DSM 21788]|uniref:SAM-dependent methyltransferase n=1 Tax=Flavobacterium rivuli WB 3.3-2 = DSM 21788 TaxID=1121895 RepID=A0A0A2M9K9_9FLAO|nr:class I SAM-dependent methyltransferase [Flavobacterium rivuli]KGO84980.1 SAM-dependent methyltransferase [Flavobacterium rivuli WB 3.3-2 = DSM 21788]